MTNAGSDTMTATPAHRCSGKRWAGWEIAAIVGGFVVFWPLGLVALGVKLWQGEIWPGSARGDMPWQNWQSWRKPGWSNWQPAAAGAATYSGNEAFEEYRKSELERIEAERRKLEEDQKAFAEFVARVKRAKDREEFDRFMAERNAPQAS